MIVANLQTDISRSRLRELQAAVAAGRYRIDCEAVAQALLARLVRK